MAINYDSLPSTRPSNTLPAGFYKATILGAEMKESKTTHQMYLSLRYDLKDDQGNSGKLYDMQFDSEKEFLRYKLGRFINALQLDLEGTFELKDLCRIIKGKQLIVDIMVEPAKDSNPERNNINSFGHEIYYPISEWASLTGAPEKTQPINASDAIDAVVEDDTENIY